MFSQPTIPRDGPCSSSSFRDCWLASIHEDDYNRVAAIRYDEATRHKQTLRVEYHTREPESTWCAMIMHELEDKDLKYFGLEGKAGYICTLTDITLEKRAELSQKEAAQTAQNRKEQQERFIDMISHEIRNPLSAILHCTEDILEATHPKTQNPSWLLSVSEAAETIGLCVTHQQRIVDDVLTYSKLDAKMLAFTPKPSQPRKNFFKPLAIFRPEVRKKKIELEYTADISYENCGIDWVIADLDRMNQVLVNLLSNSIKFTARSTTERWIRVSIGASIERPSSYPPNVVFFKSSESALNDDATTGPEWGNGETAYIMLAVKDSGIGISDQGQKRLFERFNQATPGRTVPTLCHIHGGEIGVSSKEGEGSTFGFFFKVRRTSPEANANAKGSDGDTSAVEKLSAEIQSFGNDLSGVNQSTEKPAISEKPALSEADSVDNERTKYSLGLARQVSNEQTERDAQDAAQVHDEDKTTRPRILLVEDNIINMRIISRRLKSLGLDITESFDGQGAVDAVKSNDFDCILMDQEMPGMDGYEATKAIRGLAKESGSRVPILGVTANVRAEQREKMLEAGMDDIIYKPYSTDDILEKIQRLIDHTK
ncbi:hypothetical protein N7468_002168 [Penicillium chermesinum]|uniref:histidine kinase n=1 Tax=Penicillium chermesinum TaxID=63820 RepID=A0A9W9PI39_9EURO|nr:uncharacterized protein N7468_002168 [Penicillium chermesinum]KAJ5247185.1 hypothetical protein N7468_002168 [Penicillium chermesinum]